MSDGEGLVGIFRKIHPRHVIWGLLVALFTLVAFVGKQYHNRLEALEGYKKEQNGHLRHIDVRLEKIDTNIEWIKGKLK